MDDASSDSERISFLKLAFLFQGSLLLVAMAGGWLVGQPDWTKYRLSIDGIGWGVIATIPMLVFLALVYQSRMKRLIEIRELLQEVLGRPLAACGWFDLCALALLAGVSEEYLFRGVLEPWLCGWGPVVGLIACNILFGLCHAVTPLYAVLAGLVGVYLSLTLRLTNEPNLIVPISCHALYDLVAFTVVRKSFRESGGDEKQSSSSTDIPVCES